MDKRPFLQWFVLVLGFVTATFFAGDYGILRLVWETDVTYMTSVIAVVAIIATIYLGWASWRIGAVDRKTSIADAGLGHDAATSVTMIGLLGTAIGLSHQVRAMAQVDFSNIQNIVGFVSTIGSAMGTALYATICGIVAWVVITTLLANLKFFIVLSGGEME